MAKNMQMELIGLGLEMKNAQIPNNFGNQSLPNLKVGWKSTQCFIKFLNKPQGINLGIKDAAKTDRFPMLTVCGVDSDEEYGMRWNLSHLSHCGIQR